MEFDGKGTPVAMPVGMTDEDAEAYNALRALEERRKVRRRNKIIKTIAVLAAVAVGVGIWYFVTHAPQPEEEEEYIPETAVVTREDFSTSIEGSGTLQAASMSTVNPGVEGELNEMLVSEGDFVEKGQVLFTLTSDEVDSAIEEAGEGVSDAEKELADAQKALKSVQAKYKKAKSKYSSQKKKHDAAVEKAKRLGDKAYKKTYDKLVAEIPKTATEKEKQEAIEEAMKLAQKAYDRAYHEIAIPEIDEELGEDYEGYEEEIESAKSAVSEARGALSAAQDAYGKAASGRDKCTVTAPQSGTVVSVSGATASSGDEEADTSSASVKIADMSSMKVSVQVNETEISTVKVGQRAKATFSAFPDLELDAEVSNIASMANGAEESYDYEGVVTFRVDLVIPHPDERLKPGMTAKVEILTQDYPNVLVVPPSALIEEDDGTYVDLVLDEETYETEHRKVKVGAQNSSQAIIKKGLKEDDVVLSGGDDYGDLEEDEEFDEEYDEEYDEGLDEDFEMLEEE